MNKKQRTKEYKKALEHLKEIYIKTPPPYSKEQKLELITEIKKITPYLELGDKWLDAMLKHFAKSGLNKRTIQQWQEIFPPYPIDSDGFASSFGVKESDKYLPLLDQHGIVVVKVLDKETCETTIKAIFEEVNAMPLAPGRKMEISLDPTSWEDCNWPQNFKFLLPRRAFHKQAFLNRTCDNIYKVFCAIWQQAQLRVSIDNWGIVRGTTNLKMDKENGESCIENRPQWSRHLTPHWDYNPWLFVDEINSGRTPGYQALVALRDDSPEMSCHITLPGGANFLKQWCAENSRPKKLGNRRSSYRPDINNPIIDYMQKIMVRQGDMIIWSWGQLHGTTPNYSHNIRLVQYIHMFPAYEVDEYYERYERHAPQKVLFQYANKYDFDFTCLDKKAKKLLGLESWNYA